MAERKRQKVDAQNEKPAVSVDQMTSQDYYFDSNAHFATHEAKLKDENWIHFYRNSIVESARLFEEKVVMEVGCGTALLSMFAAQAGAARVFAIESSCFVEYTEKIVRDNNLSGVVTVIKGKIDEVTLPDGVEEVDIIMSEWMGTCLFFDSKLESMLFARDKWLKPGGLLFPDKACLYLKGIENVFLKEQKVEWWDYVYGFSMSAIKRVVFGDPLNEAVHTSQMVTNTALVKEVDLYTFTKEDLEFTSPFTLKADRDDYITALMTYFSVEFTKGYYHPRTTTSPDNYLTSWKQTIFNLKSDITCKKDEVINGTFTMRTKRGPRDSTELNFEISINFQGEYSTVVEKNSFEMKKY